MNHQLIYQKKLKNAESAVELIPNNSTLLVAIGAGAPPAILTAIANRVQNDDLKQLKLYYDISTKNLHDTLLKEDILKKINANSFFITDIDRQIIKRQIETGWKLLSYVPCNFSCIPNLIRNSIKVNTFIITVSPMDRAGYFSLGTNNDFSSTAARHCDYLIVEVNPNMPRVFGSSQIHISQVNAIIENERPLVEFFSIIPDETDLKIGKLVAEFVPNGATIQIGVGKVSEGVTNALKSHKDLGIHTGLFSNGMVRLIEENVVTGRKKALHAEKHVFTVALGDKNTYDFMSDNPAMESYSAEYVNNISTIAKHKNFISINTAIAVDLYGQVNAEFIAEHEYSGAGGQFDFVKGSASSEGGKSIIALRATAKEGAISTIVPKVGMVTDVRMDVEYIVTEHGVVNLKGKSTKERALALISIAEPKFQQELINAAKQLTLI